MIKCVLLFLFVMTSVSVSQKIKVACIGNSITEGNMGGVYPDYLQEKLGNEYEVLNAGVSGTTLLKQGDKPYWIHGKLDDVFSFQPDVVTIKLGTNDTKSQNWNAYGTSFKDDFSSMVDTLEKLDSEPEIHPVLPVPVFREAWGINNQTINLIIPIIKEIAEERELTIIDANTPLKDYGYCFSDGVHPDEEGAEKIADVLYAALTTVTKVDNPICFNHRLYIGNSVPYVYMKNFSSKTNASFYSLKGVRIPFSGNIQKSCSVIIEIPRKR